MNVTHLECGLCGLEHEARRLLNLCRECGKPLLVRYDLNRSKTSLTKESLAGRRPDLWRYREVLPVENDDNIISLGEGWTPLMAAKRLGEAVGIRELYIKDESQNPTQSFKARGMAVAVSMTWSCMYAVREPLASSTWPGGGRHAAASTRVCVEKV